MLVSINSTSEGKRLISRRLYANCSRFIDLLYPLRGAEHRIKSNKALRISFYLTPTSVNIPKFSKFNPNIIQIYAEPNGSLHILIPAEPIISFASLPWLGVNVKVLHTKRVKSCETS